MVICGEQLERHIIAHEILGIGTGSPISDLKVVDGLVWVYDITRNKWLSTSRMYPTAGRRGRAKNLYLYIDDSIATSVTGYRLNRDATITSLIAQTRRDEIWSLKIRRNNILIDIAVLNMNNVSGHHDNTLNVDLNAGDMLQFYAETTTFLGIKDPVVIAEIAWRKEL